MDASEARSRLSRAIGELGAILNFGRSDAGAPANAPWLTGTVLLYLEDAREAAGEAMDGIADAEELGEDAGALEPGTMELVDPRRPM